MFGLLPRHSCHPISQSGRGASARETSGRPACNRTCVCVRLAKILSYLTRSLAASIFTAMRSQSYELVAFELGTPQTEQTAPDEQRSQRRQKQQLELDRVGSLNARTLEALITEAWARVH